MENKRFITVLVFILLLIMVLPIIKYTQELKGREIIKAFDELYNNEDKYSFIEIGYDECSACQNQKPILDNLVSKYGLEYLYINTKTISNGQLEYIKEKIDAPSDFGTPTMAIIGKGDVHETIVGTTEETELAHYLEEYEIIKDYGFKDLKEITYDEYYKLLKSKKPVAILIQREGCSWCEKAIPELERVAYLNNITIYSINAYDVYYAEVYPKNATSSQLAQANKFMPTVPSFDEPGFFTPLLEIVQNGKVKAAYEKGYATAETYEKFLKDNNFIK